jgi:hypothetical protein
MTDTMDAYTLEDAENDSYLMVQNEDISKASVEVGKAIEEKELSDTIDHFLQDGRFLAFAFEVINAEAAALSQALQLPSFSGDPSSRQARARKKREAKKAVELSNIRASLPIIISATSLQDAQMFVTTSKDTSLKQLQRDVERDRYLVNGQLLVGADGGLDGVLANVAKVMNTVVTECDLKRLDKSITDKMCISLLKKASRTNSGGLAYSALQTIVGPDSGFIIVPESQMAPPLLVRVSIARFTGKDKEKKRKVDGTLPGTTGAQETGGTEEGDNDEHTDEYDDFSEKEYVNIDPDEYAAAFVSRWDSDMRTTWGLIFRVACVTYFNLKNVDVDEVVGGSESKGAEEKPLMPLLKVQYECEMCLPMTLRGPILRGGAADIEDSVLSTPGRIVISESA